MNDQKQNSDSLLDGETQLNVRTSTISNKWFLLQVKFTAPRDYFRHFEALSIFGGFPSIEDFIRQNFHKLVDEYCQEAVSRLRQAGQPDFAASKRKSNN